MGNKFELNKSPNTRKSNGAARVRCEGANPAFPSNGLESRQEVRLQLMVPNESQSLFFV